jgi:hypothetical protein
MMKKFGVFLFAASMSVSYAFAAGDVNACYASCWQKLAWCDASTGGSPICDDLANHCFANCGK